MGTCRATALIIIPLDVRPPRCSLQRGSPLQSQQCTSMYSSPRHSLVVAVGAAEGTGAAARLCCWSPVFKPAEPSPRAGCPGYSVVQPKGVVVKRRLDPRRMLWEVMGI